MSNRKGNIGWFGCLCVHWMIINFTQDAESTADPKNALLSNDELDAESTSDPKNSILSNDEQFCDGACQMPGTASKSPASSQTSCCDSPPMGAQTEDVLTDINNNLLQECLDLLGSGYACFSMVNFGGNDSWV